MKQKQLFSMSSEIIGICASLLVLFAFAQRDERKIRLFDMAGAILYVVYGMMIHSYANILLNGALIGIQIYHLHLKQRKK